MHRIPLALSFALAAAGCGQASDDVSAEFDREFRASCTAAATRGVVPEAVASQVCDCTLEAINQKFSATEKLTLSADQAQPITAECMRKAGLE